MHDPTCRSGSRPGRRGRTCDDPARHRVMASSKAAASPLHLAVASWREATVVTEFSFIDLLAEGIASLKRGPLSSILYMQIIARATNVFEVQRLYARV